MLALGSIWLPITLDSGQRIGEGSGDVSPSAADLATSTTAAARGDVRRRLDVAAAFYDQRDQPPGRPSIQGYRRAELAFMRWQAARGVFAALDAARPGSAWWQMVNEGLLRDAWEARHLLAGAAGAPSCPAVARWVEFLQSPSPRSWYLAHNASVVAGYIRHRHLADAELPVERFFMDVALGRVLFVQALVGDSRLALGRWLWPLARRLGDPRWPGANLYLSMRNVLPDRYPLTGITIGQILAAENPIGRLIDYGVLIPRAQALYEFAAEELNEPALLEFICGGNLVYAWPYEDRAAWVSTRAIAATRLVARITPHP
jgi:hypothetical protein